ncbi:MAG: hypothetical protein ACO23N_04280 [Opitutales bacterium]
MTHPSTSPRDRQGFALVLSLTVMSLIVLVVLTTAGFLNLESRIADMAVRSAMARHNALMSARLALAQLQLLAGPDQRVTATGGIIDTTNTTWGAAPTNPNYAVFTGVWHAGPKLDSKSRRLPPLQRSTKGFLHDTRFTEESGATVVAGTNADGKAYDWATDRERTTSDGRLLGWLVSGNEGLPLAATTYTGPRTAWAVGVAGRVPLVANVTAGTAASAEGTLAVPTGRVELPPVTLPGPSSTSYGAGGSIVTGRYAWWVGDEGVKARINLSDPYAGLQPDDANVTAGGYYRLMTSQRNNFTLVRDSASTTPFSGWDTASATSVANASTFAQLRTALGLASTVDLAQFYHDVSFTSLGIHADTLRGGLKRDLTAYLNLPVGTASIAGVAWSGTAPDPGFAQALPGVSDSDAILPVALPGSLSAATASAFFAGTSPRFGVARSWFNQKSGNTWASSAVPVTLPTQRLSYIGGNTVNSQNYSVARINSQTAAAVHPLVTQMNVFFRPAYDSTNGVALFLVYPRVVLWNPWNVPIQSTQYVMDVGNRFGVRATINYSGTSGGAPASGQIVTRFGNNVTTVETSQNHPNTGSSVRLTSLVFPIPATDFQPGEALVFTAPSGGRTLIRDVARPMAAGSANGLAHTLAPAATLTGGNFNYFKSVIGNLPEPFLSMSRGSGGATLASTSVTYSGSNYYDWSMQWLESSYDYTVSQGLSFLLDATGTRALQMIDSDAFQRGNLGRWVGLSNDTLATYPDVVGGAPADIAPHRISSLNYRMVWNDDPNIPGGASAADGTGSYGNFNRQFNLFVQNNVRAPRFVRSPWDLCFRRRANHDRNYGIWMTERDPLAYTDNQLAPLVSGARSRAAPFMSSSGVSANHVYTLYDLPQANLGVLSLGQLQHAPLAIFPWQPSLALGNGYADPSVAFASTDAPGPARNAKHAVTAQPLSDQTLLLSSNLRGLPTQSHQRETDGNGIVTASNTDVYLVYDFAFELNAAIWDSWFVSGIPALNAGWTSATTPWDATTLSTGSLSPNARVVPLGSKQLPSLAVNPLPSLYYASASTAVAGAFNVNSTSVRAWTAFLSSQRNLKVNTALSGSDNTGTPILRHLRPQAGKLGVSPASTPGVPADRSFDRNAWAGYRSLTDAEIAELATQIVAEVRRRGPFLSLSDFINHRLQPVDPETAGYTHPGVMGTLQAAIENSATSLSNASNFGGAALASSSATAYGGTSSLIQRNSVADYADPEDNAKHRPRAELRVAHRAAGAPGYLLQSDILQQLAPCLTARSDTFTIRAYGQATDTSGARVLGEAWCELTVQRMPDPCNPEVRSNDAAGNLGPAAINPRLNALRTDGTFLNDTDQAPKLDLGRRFRIVGFRWLNRNEL